MYNIYMNEHTKVSTFSYKNKCYHNGTKILFNGKCILNGNEVFLNNAIVSFMYSQDKYKYLKYNNNVYMCPCVNFETCVIKIVTDENKAPPIKDLAKEKEEFYWTDSMVVKTIWYVIIMLAATIFHDRIGIWILATVIWYFSTFKNK